MQQKNNGIVRILQKMFRDVKIRVLSSEIFYINGPQTLPPPLEKDEEEELENIIVLTGDVTGGINSSKSRTGTRGRLDRVVYTSTTSVIYS